MHKLNDWRPFADVRGGGEDPTPNPPQVDLQNPAVQEAIKAAVTEATRGLEANRNEILGEKKQLEEKFQTLSKTWEGLDPEQIRGIVKHMETSEEAKLIAEGKVDEVVNRRSSRAIAEANKKAETLQAQTEEKDQAITALQARLNKQIVQNSIAAAATKIEGFNPEAVAHAILQGQQIFTADENDQPIALDSDGARVFGKDGKNPLGPEEWLRSQVEGPCKFWLLPSKGGGAAGGGDPHKKSGKTDADNLSATGKLAAGLRDAVA